MPEKRSLQETASDSAAAGEQKKETVRGMMGREAAGESPRKTTTLRSSALRRIRDLLGDYSEQTGSFF